jgi:integrase
MLYKEKWIDTIDINEIDKKIYELGQNALNYFDKKKTWKHNDNSNKIVIFYLVYLFGLRVSEALRINLNRDLEKKKIGNKEYYILHSINLKQKDIKNKEKVIFLYISNEYEKKMLNFILENFSVYKNITRFDIASFCKRYIKDYLIVYDKNNNEYKVFTHLNIHSLRHLRAYVLLKRYNDKEVLLNNFGWKKENMLYYYTQIAKTLKEMEIEKKFINLLKSL